MPPPPFPQPRLRNNPAPHLTCSSANSTELTPLLSPPLPTPSLHHPRSLSLFGTLTTATSVPTTRLCAWPQPPGRLFITSLKPCPHPVGPSLTHTSDETRVRSPSMPGSPGVLAGCGVAFFNGEQNPGLLGPKSEPRDSPWAPCPLSLRCPMPSHCAGPGSIMFTSDDTAPRAPGPADLRALTSCPRRAPSGGSLSLGLCTGGPGLRLRPLELHLRAPCVTSPSFRCQLEGHFLREGAPDPCSGHAPAIAVTLTGSLFVVCFLWAPPGYCLSSQQNVPLESTNRNKEGASDSC